MGMSVQERLFALKDEDFCTISKRADSEYTERDGRRRAHADDTQAGEGNRRRSGNAGVSDRTAACVLRRKHAHSVLLSRMKGYGACMEAVEAFLPYVDNWAVCDCLSPKVFAKHKPELMEKIRKWVKAEHVYTCRFGLEMLMTHFLDADFKPECLDLAADMRLEDYYAKMMAAWFLPRRWPSSGTRQSRIWKPVGLNRGRITRRFRRRGRVTGFRRNRRRI